MKDRKTAITAKLKTVISGLLSIPEEEITNESSIGDDLGADSLDEVELVMSIERDFLISIPDEDLPIKTVGDYIDYLNTHKSLVI